MALERTFSIVKPDGVANNLIGQDKFTEAEQLIDSLPDEQRVSALVNLADEVFGRNPKENKSYATALLAKASQARLSSQLLVSVDGASVWQDRKSVV